MMRSSLKNFFQNKWLLFFGLILFLGGFFRFSGLSWDEGSFQHPDERYIAMTADSLEKPSSWQEYWDPEVSVVSPYNQGFPSYIYGTLPLFLVRFISWIPQFLYLFSFQAMSLADLILVGRFFSALFSLGSVVLVFLISEQIFDKKVGLVASFLWAVNPLSIQSAHFWTMESFYLFFMMFVFLICLWWLNTLNRKKFIWRVSLFWGIALACKLNMIFLGGIIGLSLLAGEFLVRKQELTPFFPVKNWSQWGKLIFSVIFYFILILVLTALFFRFFQPVIFRSASLFDWRLQPDFYQAFSFQWKAMKGEVMFPPSYQWLNKTPYFSVFKNLFFWGIGLFSFSLSFLGLILLISELVKKPWFWVKSNFQKLIILLWISFYCFYQAGAFVCPMRYLMPFIPFFLILGGYFISWGRRYRLPRFFSAICLLGSLFYGFAFSSIYQRETTRVSASKWLYENVSSGQVILNEHWDDHLPLYLPGYIRDFEMSVLEVYRQDNEEKIDYLVQELSQADYLIISSNRAWGSIGQQEENFPVMSLYYDLLFAEELGFSLVKDFRVFPRFLGIEFNDSRAEEIFTVYEHPQVFIFRKEVNRDWRSLLVK